jgi:phytoene desaturase
MPVSELSTAKYQFDDQTINKYRKQAIAKVSRLPGCENIEQEIVSESIMTPNDFAEKFSAYNGATFGLQPTLRQSNHWRPQAKSKDCEGLYFAGSSVHPGAGVPIVLQSGKIAAEELRRDNPEDSFT